MPKIRPPGPRGVTLVSSGIIQKHKGAHAELIACAWLLSNGYEVYRNISAVGDADLVARKGARIMLLDVKSGNYGNGLTKEQTQGGILLLRVLSSGCCAIEGITL